MINNEEWFTILCTGTYIDWQPQYNFPMGQTKHTPHIFLFHAASPHIVSYTSLPCKSMSFLIRKMKAIISALFLFSFFN